MSVYNKTELKNLAINIEAKNALDEELITTDEFQCISKEYKFGLYIPKFAIKIGLFVLVVILSGVFFGLLALLFYDSFKGYGFISIFMFFVTLICTYFFSTKKMHFGSGADTAFLYCSIIFFMIWCASAFESLSGRGSSLMLFILSLVGSILFIDRFLVIVGAVSFLFFIYYSLLHVFYFDVILICLIGVSFLIVYFSFKYLSKVDYWNSKLLNTLMYTGLTTLFITTNAYYLQMIVYNKINFTIVFNVLTLIVPLVYILFGLRYKNLIFLRVGTIVFLAAVYSFIARYAMNNIFEYLCISGALLTVFSWWLSRYLTTEKSGFVFTDKSNFSNQEAIGAINTATPPTSGIEFGGGSFGGGGASGEF